MPYNADLFIKKLEDEEISWTVYLNPISAGVWMTLIFVSIIIALILSVIDQLFGKPSHNHKLQFISFMISFWIAFKANFGGKPSVINSKHTTNKIVIFICLLSGSLFWIAYRASLTSELSVVNVKKPFNDLEGLLKSDYRYKS